ncbi:DUF3310 domain-containing protein [Mammaliicoccus lentus]|uniref:DUF3310 domain-containing protein n=1 Tax=Mammaliicoccus lentus TaxID=42858 RepID=UPI001C4EAF2B|nr:DUF3310 domain-containing protein [Mammaliicoccus lentus]MBW0761366.1 DUF3310 domain-containing protein [Mammaliicoccus lentus]
MKFKEGDRVHVLRYNGEDVDFYGRISQISPQYYFLDSCTEDTVKLPIVLLNPNNIFYGSDGRDYYVLAEDEEDTEAPVIQRTAPPHYQADIDVIEFCRQHFTEEEFRGAMKFNLIKYPTRLGLKDEEIKELDKIIDYAERYKEVLKR